MARTRRVEEDAINVAPDITDRRDETGPPITDDDEIDSRIEEGNNNESYINLDKVDDGLVAFDSSDWAALVEEQKADETLKSAFSLARRGKGGYLINNGVLFQVSSYCGQKVTSLVVPVGRRLGVIKLAHNSVHWAANKTKQRIILSGLTWPTLSSEVRNK